MLTEPDGGYDRAFSGRYNITVTSSVDNRKRCRLVGSQGALYRFLKNAGYATAHYGKWHGERHDSGCSFHSAYGYDDYGAFNCSGPQMYVMTRQKRHSLHRAQ